MPTSITEKMPKGHDGKNIAEIFSAWLLGSMAFDNVSRRYGPFHEYGPFPQDDKWQLDGSNDYWLRVTEDGNFVLSCRYEPQGEVIAAMMNLFTARFVNR